MIRPAHQITPAEVAAHYDALDSFYRQIWGAHVHHGLWRTGRETRKQAVHALCEAIAAELSLPAGAHVCDIGSGYGATSRFLARTHDFQVTAVTLSPAQSAFAKSLDPSATNPAYLTDDWLENHFPDASFDAAVAIESSEQMPSLEAFFRQARRVLRRGGPLVISAWLSADLPSAWQRRVLLEPICRAGRMPAMYTAAEYQTFAAAHAFRLRRFQDLTREAAPTWPHIAATFLRTLLRHPRHLRILRHARNWSFALAALRLSLAYRCHAMRYAIFTFTAA